MGLSFALAKSARADRSLTDRDLIAAAGSLAKSYQTLVNSSLIYEPQTPTWRTRASLAKLRPWSGNFARLSSETYWPHAAPGFRRPEGARIPFAHGLGAHFRQAEVAGVRRFPVCAVPRKGLGDCRTRRGGEPDRDSVGFVFRAGSEEHGGKQSFCGRGLAERGEPRHHKGARGHRGIQSRLTVCPSARAARRSRAVFPSPG
jgi:hypothetical protein